MRGNLTILAVACLALAGMGVQRTHGITVMPGESATFSEPGAAPTGVLLQTRTLTYWELAGAPSIAPVGTYQTSVWQRTQDGTLDFGFRTSTLYSYKELASITVEGFGGGTTDVGFIPDGALAPVGVTRSVDGGSLTVYFPLTVPGLPGLNLVPKQWTDTVVIHTNARQYATASASMHFLEQGPGGTLDGSVFSLGTPDGLLQSLAPAAVPEPTVAGLMALGGFMWWGKRTLSR